MLKSHFSMIVTVVLALIMGIVMSVAAILIDHLPFHICNLYKICGMVVLNVIVISLFVPYQKWSEMLCSRLGLQKETIPYTLVSNLIPTLIFNTANTLFISGANIFFNDMIPKEAQLGAWLGGIVKDWPVMFVISFAAALIAGKIGVSTAQKVLRET